MASTESYRERCLAEKGRECTICGDSNDIHVHHIDGDRNNNDLDNLIPVCTTHHSRIHAGYEEVWEWYEKLDEQRGAVEGTAYTSISVPVELQERLEAQKANGQTWGEFFVELLHRYENTDDTQRIPTDQVNEIAEMAAKRTTDELETRLR